MRKLTDILIIIPIVLLGAIVLLISLPFIIISYPFSWLRNKKFENDYREYLIQLEGKNFFCYNNKQSSKDFIENELIPNLPESVELIYLNGRIPESKYEKKFISHILYQFKNYQGFPQLLKIRNCETFDDSIRSDVFNTINQNKSTDGLFIKILNFYKTSEMNENAA
jgi:hypothetical protein